MKGKDKEKGGAEERRKRCRGTPKDIWKLLSAGASCCEIEREGRERERETLPAKKFCLRGALKGRERERDRRGDFSSAPFSQSGLFFAVVFLVLWVLYSSSLIFELCMSFLFLLSLFFLSLSRYLVSSFYEASIESSENN